MSNSHRIPRFALLGLLLAAPATQAQIGTTSVVSADSRGQMAVLGAWDCCISPDGRFVGFETHSPDLVPNDGNTWSDVFLKDRVTGETVLVSVSLSGVGGNAGSYGTSVSEGGLFVAFSSNSTDLAAGVGVGGVYVRDRLAGVTELASTDSSGLPAGGVSTDPSISADGQVVAFESTATNLVRDDGNGVSDIFVRNRTTGETVLASVGWDGSPANGFSRNAALSLDGEHVAFESVASNLVPDDTNGFIDVFVRDLVTGQTELVDRDSNGVQVGVAAYPAISRDGRFVAFLGEGGQFVPGDNNGKTDIFVRDRVTGQTSAASVSSTGQFGNDWSGQTFEFYDERWLSADGRFVAFMSSATNLVPNDVNARDDVFLHDGLSGQTTLVSLDAHNGLADGNSDGPSMSADGRYIAFESIANDLVANDTTPSFNQPDAFVRDRSPWTNLGSALAGGFGPPDFSALGTLIAGQPGSLLLQRALPGAPSALLIGIPGTPVPFKGGLLYPVPPVLQIGFVVGPGGTVSLNFTWPGGIPADTILRMQFAIADPAAVHGVALSNALEALVP